jgi:L-alanine-DL-glutamate epimerase-like enolase superfamily enzyme
VPRLFEYLRKHLGDEVELLHDMHERVPPVLALRLAKDLEQFRLFFLEDPFSPEDVGYFTHLRKQCTTPIAMGELFNNPNEWLSLVTGRLIDFIRIHISQVGGLSMARKVAALCEFFAVRTLPFCTAPPTMMGRPVWSWKQGENDVRQQGNRHQLPQVQRPETTQGALRQAAGRRCRSVVPA